MFPEQEDGTLKLSHTEASAIWSFLYEHAFDPFTSESSFEDFIDTAFRLNEILPMHITKQLLRFRRHGNQHGVVVIRGLKFDQQRLGPTPLHWSMSAQTKRAFESEMYLLGAASILGEFFAFRTQHEGNIIQNIMPLSTDSYEQVGTGSRVFLEWHTEDAFHHLRADYIGLLCLRSDPSAATTFSSIRNMQIPAEFKQLLFEKRYQAGIDKAHGGTGRPEDGPVISIFSGSFDDPYLRIDTSCIRALPSDTRAAEALECLKQSMNDNGRQIVLEEGDLLFMDNLRVVHGRTAFAPRFDGQDRWLQRVSIAADFRKSHPYRTINTRVIELCEEMFF